ncbi:type II toxin-antitoxin system RelE/ParE family toxin [Candidatus Fermentibacteria bacterium]|nr:type II toxin-antitoxin system RelE/ParE family toxin [Candidatus Fermentibacteria bacterium]
MAVCSGRVYRIRFTPEARRNLEALPKSALRRIDARILQLAVSPRPEGAITLQGGDGLLRLRVGDYRIIYRIEDEVLLILVIRIGHRRDVYRRR